MQQVTLVIFGGTGDLAQHKLFPALHTLFLQGKLPEDFLIFGFSRRAMTDQEYQELIKESIPSASEAFLSHVAYQQGEFNTPDGYELLHQTMTKLPGTHIFYLATPPEHYESILTALCDHGVCNGESRIAIEKPFGKDLESAQALDNRLAEMFHEQQIFRVDHYLGKEVLQNILYFRFANTIFEPIWTSEYIDNVQLTFFEDKTIHGRGKFFDGVGMLRDVGQNHLMQMLAAVVMEQPASFTKEDVRSKRAEAIEALTPITDIAHGVVRGQYEGYLEEKDVLPDSQTETLVGLKFFVNTPRFTGVPFYMRAGKAMARPEVSISIVFKQTCHILFKEIGCPEIGNVLTFRIQPHEGISLRTITKTPGTKPGLESVDLHFSYKEAYGNAGSDAYEKVLLDVITGDQMLFNRSDEMVASWKFITDIMKGLGSVPLQSYDKGSEEIPALTELIERDGRKWL